MGNSKKGFEKDTPDKCRGIGYFPIPSFVLDAKKLVWTAPFRPWDYRRYGCAILPGQNDHLDEHWIGHRPGRNIRELKRRMGGRYAGRMVLNGIQSNPRLHFRAEIRSGNQFRNDGFGGSLLVGVVESA